MNVREINILTGEELPIRPYTQEELDANAAGFIADFPATLKSYRDLAATTTVSYLNYEVKNDDLTRNRLAQKLIEMTLKPEITVLWKCSNGFFELNGSDIQGLYDACMVKLQKAFDTQSAIAATHAETPYTSFEEMKSDFDDLMLS